MDLTGNLHQENEEDICDATVSSSNENSDKNKPGILPLTTEESNMPEINSRTQKRDLLASIEQIGLPNSWSEDDPSFPLPNRCVLDFLPLLPAQATFSEMPDLDSHSKAVTSGVCGLHNLGNTCFMNSGLQCLLNNRNLVSFFLDSYDSNEIAKDTLSTQFAQIMSKVWNGRHSTLKPIEFKDALGVWHPQFRDYRQHDCQEFLALLLDTLHEQLNVDSSKNIAIHSKKDVEMDESQTQMEADDIISPKDSASFKAFVEPKEVAFNGSSENSNSTSPHSTDSFGSWDTNPSFRLYPVPEDVKPFSDVSIPGNSKEGVKSDLEAPNNNDKSCNSNLIPLEELANKGGSIVKKNPIEAMSSGSEGKFVKNELANCINTVRKIPKIEDFVKETKTLNTNMLVTEEANNLLKYDSEKFPKTEPPMRPHEALDNLSNLMAIDDAGTSKKESTVVGSLKRLKETNVLQERKENSSRVLKRIKMDGKEEHTDDESASVHMKDDTFDADSEWAKYHSRNQSVIVDTFQGQFKSTVICSECGHISVTYEPFMYLPVPLPYALERQIVLTYVPRENRSLVRYLLTVHKNDKLFKLKEALMKALTDDGSQQPEEIVLAEIFDNHISRILEDNILVRYINDTNREVYAFEVNNFNKPSYNDADTVRPGSSLEEVDVTSNETPPSNSQLSTLGVGGDCRQQFQPLISGSGEHCVTSSSTTDLPHWSELGDHENTLPMGDVSFSSESVSSTTRDEFGPSTSTNIQHSSDMISSIVASSSCLTDCIVQDNSGDNLFRGPQLRPWHSCAICLEEMPDIQLRTHPPCQCVLCHSCIEISFKHYGNSLICPVCGVPVKSEDEFVPLLKMDNYKMKIRLISVPVVFRLHDTGQLKLTGHPTLLRIPDSLPAGTLYECIDKCVPFLATYSLFFVDGQGKNCSRCNYTHKCTGCEVSRFGDISMQVGDNLAVTFDIHSNDFPLEEILTTNVENHKSMLQKRVLKESLTLYDCLKAFSESETLDEQNPWFCPACQQHRQARKSLSVWRCPDTLMVYLKRFMFHEFSSTKVDDKVLFPLEGLDLSPFISGPTKDFQPYNLQACVCHFGGVSSGHYTAYSKHTVSGEWNYFNDDTTREQKPQEDDNVHAYILFYQKPGA